MAEFEDIKSLFQCKLCHELLKRSARCESGHTICETCGSKVTLCPLCSNKMATGRNYIIESLIEHLFSESIADADAEKNVTATVGVDRPRIRVRCPNEGCRAILDGYFETVNHLQTNHSVSIINMRPNGYLRFFIENHNSKLEIMRKIVHYKKALFIVLVKIHHKEEKISVKVGIYDYSRQNFTFTVNDGKQTRFVATYSQLKNDAGLVFRFADCQHKTIKVFILESKL